MPSSELLWGFQLFYCYVASPTAQIRAAYYGSPVKLVPVFKVVLSFIGCSMVGCIPGELYHLMAGELPYGYDYEFPCPTRWGWRVMSWSAPLAVVMFAIELSCVAMGARRCCQRSPGITIRGHTDWPWFSMFGWIWFAFVIISSHF